MGTKTGTIQSGILIQVKEEGLGNVCEIQPYGDLFTIKAHVIGYLEERNKRGLPCERIAHLESRPISFIVQDWQGDRCSIVITAPADPH